MIFGKQAFFQQLLLQLFKSHLKGSRPHRFGILENDLVASTGFVDSDPPKDHHGHTVIQFKFELSQLTAKQNRRDLGLLVLQSKVGMPGRWNS